MRSPVQPLRRNSALYRVYDDLILWLKFENNFADSSFYYQQTSGLHPNVVPPGHVDYYDGTYTLPNHYENLVDLPSFDEGRYKSAPYSAYFGSGQQFVQEGWVFCKMAPCPQPGHYLSGCSVMVSGTGVYTTAPDFDSAAEFDLQDDFTIEFYAQFSGVPDSSEPSTLFDFGSLKLTNTSGFYSVHTRFNGSNDEEVFDYYDPDFAYPVAGADWAPSMTNTWTHYAIQRRDNEMSFWMGSRDKNGVDNNPFLIRANDFDGGGLVSGDRSDPYRSCRTVGSSISGTNFFSGWIDEFKVWKRALYDGVVCPGGPSVKGIYVDLNWRATFRSQAAIASILSKDYSQPSSEVHYVDKGMDPLLWCKINSVYDPRYSVHEPLPYEVDWYKDRLSQKNHIGTSRLARFNSTNWATQKFVVGAKGLGEIIVKDFQPEDEGWYYAVIKMGPPNRPKYQWTHPQVVRQYLKYRFTPPPCPFGGVWPNCSCFGEDTKVLLQGQVEKRIVDLIKGDRVYSFNENDEITKSIVTNIEKNKADFYYELVVNDKPIKVTSDHPIYLGGGEYKPVKELEVNDLVSIFENKKLIQAPIQSKKKIEKRIDVYNISVDSDSTYFVNGIAVHNKSPVQYPRLAFLRCPGIVAYGGSASLQAHFVNSTPTLPLQWHWTNTGRGTVTDFGVSQTWSITNLTKSMKGDICVSALDADGKSYGPVCCPAPRIKLPKLTCPTLTSVDPSTSNKDITVTSPLYWSYGQAYHNTGTSCFAYTQMSIVPDQPDFNLELKVNAQDDEAPSLNTGGLKYEWYEGSYGFGGTPIGTQSTLSRNILDNTNRVYTCRISFNNYPATQHTLDPEGAVQYGAHYNVYFYINYAECHEPYAAISQIPYSWSSGTYNQTRQQPRSLSTAGGDHTTETRTVTIYNCTDDYEITLDFLGIDDGSYWANLLKSRGRGFVRNLTIGDGIEISGSYKSYKIIQPSTRGYNNMDKFVIYKDIYKNDDGSHVTVKFNNDCGSKTIKIIFKVYQEACSGLSVSTRSRYAEMIQVCNGSCEDWWDVNFYTQKYKYYNWLSKLISETETISPTSVQFYIRQQPYSAAGCLFWQVEIDGQAVIPWTLSGGSYHNGGIQLSLYSGYSTMTIYPDKTAWPNGGGGGYHKVTIRLRNNLTAAGDPESGCGSDTEFFIRFNELPVITSTQRNPYCGWTYYCNNWYYGGRRMLRSLPHCLKTYYYWYRPCNWWYHPWRRYPWPIYMPTYPSRISRPYTPRRTLRGHPINPVPTATPEPTPSPTPDPGCDGQYSIRGVTFECNGIVINSGGRLQAADGDHITVRWPTQDCNGQGNTSYHIRIQSEPNEVSSAFRDCSGSMCSACPHYVCRDYYSGNSYTFVHRPSGAAGTNPTDPRYRLSLRGGALFTSSAATTTGESYSFWATTSNGNQAFASGKITVATTIK